MGLRTWLPGLLLTATLSAQGSDFGFDSLQQLIARQSINSVDGLIAALPEDLRSHYTLVFESRSLQEANFANPRAILFGSHATLILTYNGEPAERGYDAVETMEFDGSAQRFLFREIQFLGGSAHFSAANPPRCVACHGSPARPIWDTPPSWPGVYGQRYHAGLSGAERSGMAAFLARQPQSSALSPPAGRKGAGRSRHLCAGLACHLRRSGHRAAECAAVGIAERLEHAIDIVRNGYPPDL